ncbi:hypothetical protein NDU88_004764 [Pleurodeles waltl]|uniref:Uncharacterized protein n=1 Tax=Pleurodeles waltl TaxID=8319 RepID=A0AAV7TAN1_PLEWA|nr:hypothetical protein NDU88_004764 [Pleurodeles waltl]
MAVPLVRNSAVLTATAVLDGPQRPLTFQVIVAYSFNECTIRYNSQPTPPRSQPVGKRAILPTESDSGPLPCEELELLGFLESLKEFDEHIISRRPPGPFAEWELSWYDTYGSEFDALGSEFDALGSAFDALGSEFDALGSEFDAGRRPYMLTLLESGRKALYSWRVVSPAAACKVKRG